MVPEAVRASRLEDEEADREYAPEQEVLHRCFLAEQSAAARHPRHQMQRQ